MIMANWQWWEENDPETRGEVYSWCADEAAEAAAADYDNIDHHLTRTGAEVVLCVKDPDSGEVSRWVCTAELQPCYTVYPFKETA